MDLSNIISGIRPEATGNSSVSPRSTETADRPAPHKSSRPEPTSASNPSDQLLLEQRKNPDRKKKAVEEDQIRRMSEKHDEVEKKSYSDILKILSENAPHVMKSLKALMAQRAGLEQDKTPVVSPETLKNAVTAAAGSPDPSRRVADVMTGVGLVPDELKEKFLKAAEAMLGMESRAGAPAPLATAPGVEPGVAFHPLTGNYEPQNVGFEVEVNFDLFYSVSARASMKSGSTGAEAFYDASTSVAATFEAGFSMKVAGRFLSLADAAEGIDPEVLDAFSQAVQGLAGLDEESLNRFFDATDKLFNEVGIKLGLSTGQLDGVKEQMKGTAAGFLQAVDAATREVFPGMKVDQIFELPEGLDSNGTTDLLSMLHGLASTREEGSAVDDMLANLNGAENARSLGNSYQDLSSLEKLLGKTSDIA